MNRIFLVVREAIYQEDHPLILCYAETHEDALAYMHRREKLDIELHGRAVWEYKIDSIQRFDCV